MSEDPEVTRRDITETQARIGDAVEALAYKTDAPTRARDAVNERVDAIKEKVSQATGSIATAASDARETFANAAGAVPAPAQALQALRTVSAENPLGVAVGSIAVGFLIGLCLPVSDLERDRVGRLGERMTEQAKDAAAGALEQGKATVTQAIGDVLTSAVQRPASMQ